MSNKEKTPKATAAEANSKEDKMEDLKNEMSVQERAGQVVVKVTFMFHDLELIGDGEDSVFFFGYRRRVPQIRGVQCKSLGALYRVNDKNAYAGVSETSRKSS